MTKEKALFLVALFLGVFTIGYGTKVTYNRSQGQLAYQPTTRAQCQVQCDFEKTTCQENVRDARGRPVPTVCTAAYNACAQRCISSFPTTPTGVPTPSGPPPPLSGEGRPGVDVVQPFLDKIEKAGSFDEALSIARSGGLTVQASSNKDGEVASILRPGTKEVLAYLGEFYQTATGYPYSPDPTDPQKKGYDGEYGVCKDAETGARVLVRPDGAILGITRPYNVSVSCGVAPSDICDQTKISTSNVIAEYNKAGAVQSTGGQDTIQVVWVDKISSSRGPTSDTVVLGKATFFSTKQKDGSFKTLGVVRLSQLAAQAHNWTGGDIGFLIQHEVGHALGLGHSSNPTSFMYWQDTGDHHEITSIPSADARTLQKIKNHENIQVTYCEAIRCNDPSEVYSPENGRCIAKPEPTRPEIPTTLTPPSSGGSQACTERMGSGEHGFGRYVTCPTIYGSETCYYEDAGVKEPKCDKTFGGGGGGSGGGGGGLTDTFSWECFWDITCPLLIKNN